jgi:hypothetical protein
MADREDARTSATVSAVTWAVVSGLVLPCSNNALVLRSPRCFDLMAGVRRLPRRLHSKVLVLPE